VKLAEQVGGELEHAGEAGVDTGRAHALPPEEELGLTGEHALHAHAIAPEVHQRPAVELRQHAHVRRVGEREREARP